MYELSPNLWSVYASATVVLESQVQILRLASSLLFNNNQQNLRHNNSLQKFKSNDFIALFSIFQKTAQQTVHLSMKKTTVKVKTTPYKTASNQTSLLHSKMSLKSVLSLWLQFFSLFYFFAFIFKLFQCTHDKALTTQKYA